MFLSAPFLFSALLLILALGALGLFRRWRRAEAELAEARGRVIALETAAAKDQEAHTRERAQLEAQQRFLREQFEHLAHRIFEAQQQAFDVRTREGLGRLLAIFKIEGEEGEAATGQEVFEQRQVATQDHIFDVSLEADQKKESVEDIIAQFRKGKG